MSTVEFVIDASARPVLKPLRVVQSTCEENVVVITIIIII